MTLLFNRRSFRRKEYFLLRHTGFSLLNADVACPILFFLLTIPPSYSIQLPRYLKSWTCSIVFPLRLRIKGELDVAMLFDLPTFTISPTFSALSTMVSSSSCRSCFTSSRSTTSSAKSKSVSCCPLGFTPKPNACRRTKSITRTNWNRDDTNPCFTFEKILKNRVSPFFVQTQHLLSS